MSTLLKQRAEKVQEQLKKKPRKAVPVFAVFASALLLPTTKIAQAQTSRPIVPYTRSESEALQAEARSISAEEARIIGVYNRFMTQFVDLQKRLSNNTRRWNENEKFGQRLKGLGLSILRGSDRRLLNQYLDRRASLARERTLLDLEAKRLRDAGRGGLSDVAALERRKRRLDERNAALGGHPVLDENTPQKR